MKKLYTIIIIILLTMFAAMAQAPEKFSYQAVVRNANNHLVTNANVGVRVSILQGSATGYAVYAETHSVNTNANGLLTVVIGEGNTTQSFSAIDWSGGNYYLKTEIDPNGGTNYSITSTQQLMSVPYALYAKTAANGFSGNIADYLTPATIPAFLNALQQAGVALQSDIPNVPENVSAFNNDAQYITAAQLPIIPENQVLSISNDTIFLTNGGFVKLPAATVGFSGDYNDLTNKPTIPTVPTNVSAFQNDAGYITSADVPTFSVTQTDTGYVLTMTPPNGTAQQYVLRDGKNGADGLPGEPGLPGNDGFSPTITVVSGATGTMLTITDVNGTNQYVIPQSGGASGTLVQLPANWNETDPTSPQYIMNKPELFSGDYNDLTNKPTIPTVPTNVSAFTNDAGYITEDDLPNIPADQVLSISNDTIFLTNGGFVKLPAAAVGFSGDYNDLQNKPTIPTVPTNVSAFTNDAGYITADDIPTAPAQVNADWNATEGAAEILNKPSIPTKLSQLTNDVGYISQLPDSIGGGISTETDPVFSAWDKDYNDLINKPEIPTVPTNVSAFQNDAGYITADDIPAVPTNVSELNNDAGYITEADVQAAANIPTNVSAFTNDAGYITADDIPAVPAQVNADWNATEGAAQIINKPELFSGDYNDLQNRPTNVSAFQNDAGYITEADVQAAANIPTNVSAFTNDAGYITANDIPTIPAQVNADWDATEGAAQIINKPEIPTVPTNVSAFQNDAGYITADDIPAVPTNVSELNNDAGYITEADVQAAANIPTNVSAFTNDAGYITADDIPAVPAQVNADWDATEGAAQIINKPELFSGDYNDLQNKPANVSAFNNDAGYITEADVQAAANIPTNVSAFTNDAGYITANDIPTIPAQVNADWDATEGAAQIINKPEIPTIPADVSEFNNDAGYITANDIPAHINADWTETDPTSNAYISNKPDLSSYLTTLDLNNFVTKSDDETIGGQKTFEDNVVFNGSNVVEGSLEVPTMLNSIGNNGVFNLGDENCTNAVNFCDLQTVYNDILSKFNELNNQIDELLDSIAKLNKEKNTPKDGESCPNTPTVTDIDGNTYSTVRIGNQCWMRENLRVMHWPNGTDVTSPNTPTLGAIVAGLRYSFQDVMAAVPAAATSNPTQGICPIGWRVPSDADFNELVTYAKQKENHNKALAATFGWPYNTNINAVGYTQTNNALGFSLVSNGTSQNSNYSELYSSNMSEWDLSASNSGSTGLNIYAQNKEGKFGVRCIRANSNGENNTVNGPIVETIDSVKNITQNSAWLLGGRITDNGGMPITTYGVVVGTSASVTFGTAVKYTSSSFSSNNTIPFTMSGYSITGLNTNTQYYYRAFAINAIDTVYGEAKSFHTVQNGLACPGIATVSDIDGNTYNTVMIGSQCWLKENLKTTKNADNTPVNATTPTTNVQHTGKLYSWNDAVGSVANTVGAAPSNSMVRGICPVGWHIPNRDEWETLINQAGDYPAQALAATTGWNNSSTANTPGYNQATTNNALGLNFLLYRNHSTSARMWTSHVSGGTVEFSGTAVSPTFSENWSGPYSVRCLKDNPNTATVPTLPTVTISTGSIAGNPDLYAQAYTTNITNSGSSNVTKRGIVFGKTEYPKIEDNDVYFYQTTSQLTGTFLTGLSKSSLEAGETYYIRAFATNSEGTAYSEQRTFTAPNDGLKCPGTPTVTDKNNFSYNTVQIGTQCWMAQNLRSTFSPSGGQITSYIPNNASSANSSYGRLYDHYTIMNGSSTSTASVQGICPTGWHIPSPEEFNTLVNYVKSQNAYLCGTSSSSSAIGKAMASTSGWTESSTACAVGNNQSSNNASGFNAYPAGVLVASTSLTPYNYGERTCFRTTEVTNQFILGYYAADANPSNTGYLAQQTSASLRCIKGATPPSIQTNYTVSDLGLNKATVGGNLVSDGINTTFNSSDVTELGICYSTSDNPTLSNSKKTATVALGNFTVTLTGLSMNTTYYYRAYAKNANGTQYGVVRTFTTKNGAKVNMVNVTNIGKNTATLTGTIVRNEATIQGWGFYLYKKNSNGTYPTQATYDLYTSNTGTFTQNGITYNFSTAPQSGNYSFVITGGLESGATYKVVPQIKDNIVGNWHSTSNSTTGSESIYYFSTLHDPAVTTVSAVYSGSGCSFTITGNVTAVGNPSYYEKGVVIGNSSNPNPTISQYTYKGTVSGTSSGTFSYSCTIGNSNTTFYARTYIRNNNGVFYGNSVQFTTPTAPTMGFASNYEAPYYYSENVTKNSIKLMTNCTENGGAPLSGRGLVYTRSLGVANTGVTATNVFDDPSMASGAWVRTPQSNSSTITITGLSSNTTYYIKSYGVNPFGWSYSSVTKKVKTALNCGEILTDQNGNTYDTEKYGSLCWMQQNLKATNYDNDYVFSTSGTGTSIPYDNQYYMSYTTPYKYNPNKHFTYPSTYGYLYNWAAITGNGVSNVPNSSSSSNMSTSQGKKQGICPRGWHIPNNDEIQSLHNNFNWNFAGSRFAGGINEWGNADGFNLSLIVGSCSKVGSYGYYVYWINSNPENREKLDLNTKYATSVRCVQDITY